MVPAARRRNVRSIWTPVLAVVAVTSLALTSAGLTTALFSNPRPSGTNSFTAGTLAPPTAFTAGVSASTVTLSWTAPTTNPAGFTYVLTFDPGGNGTGGTCAASMPGTTTSCTFTGVAVGTYTYTIASAFANWRSSAPTTTATVAASGPSFGGIAGPVDRTNSDNSVTVPFPAGTNTGDLVLLVLVNAARQDSTVNTAGWTLLANPNTNSPQQFEVQTWFKVITITDLAVSVNVHTNSAGASLWTLRYTGATGVATATVRSGTAIATTTLTPSPDLTTNQPAATVISLAAIRSLNPLSLSTPQLFTLRQTASNTPSGGQSVTFSIADQTVATSGSAPASPTWSQSGVNAQWAFITMAFS